MSEFDKLKALAETPNAEMRETVYYEELSDLRSEVQELGGVLRCHINAAFTKLRIEIDNIYDGKE